MSDGPLKQTKRISVQALDWDSPAETKGRPAPPLTADPDLFRESGAMFAAGTDRKAGCAREHCDVVVGADLVYSADVVEKLCKTHRGVGLRPRLSLRTINRSGWFFRIFGEVGEAGLTVIR